MNINRKEKYMPQPQRVLVAETSKYFNNSIWRMLIPEPEFIIVGLANNTEDAVKMAHTLSPDIILADLSRSTKLGLQIIKALHAVHPTIPIISLKPNSSREYTHAALNAGAAACLTKSEMAEVLPQALYRLIPVQSSISRPSLGYSQD
jgi:DNA-binding NarL/FixJ family response regulator